MNELHLLSALLFIVATAVVIRFVTREFQPKVQRVLILGAGPLVAKLIEEIEPPPVAATSSPASWTTSSPTRTRRTARPWLGPCDQLAEIVERVQAGAHRRRRRRPPRPAAAAVAARVARQRHRRRGRDRVLRAADRQDGDRSAAAERADPVEGIPQPRRGRNASRASVSMVVAAIGLVLVAPLLALIALADQARLARPGASSSRSAPAATGGRSGCSSSGRCTRRPKRRSEWVQDNVRPHHARRPLAAPLPARRAAAARQRAARRDEPGRTAAASDRQPRDLHGATSRTTACGSTRAARRHRLGAGALRLREQPRGRNREDAVRPVLHQEPVALARPADSVRDRRHHALRPGRQRSAARRRRAAASWRRRRRAGAPTVPVRLTCPGRLAQPSTAAREPVWPAAQ